MGFPLRSLVRHQTEGRTWTLTQRDAVSRTWEVNTNRSHIIAAAFNRNCVRIGETDCSINRLLAAIDMTRPHRKVFWVCSGDSTNSTVAKELGEVAPPCAGPCDELGCNGCLGGTCVSDRDPDANFSPNLLNSVVFLITTITSVTTFLVNYKGRPYMIALKDNKLLLYTLLFGWFTIHACVLEVVPDFNAYLQLVPMPDEAFKLRLVLLMLFDVAVSFVVEKVSAFFFYRSACRTVTDSLLSR